MNVLPQSDQAAETTREVASGAKSNLAFALACLPKERRRDMVSFYAFCRTVDDIADDLGVPDERRRAQLTAWREGLEAGFENPGPIESETERLREKYAIPTELFVEVVRGMEMDIGGAVRYQSFADLQRYCYRVACAVGLVSLKIFGATHPDSERYGVALGYALQLTNILRDVGEDAGEGRVYLPLEELQRFGISERDLLEGRGGDREAFVRLMEFQAQRGERFFAEAEAAMPASDRKALRAARKMGKIYRAILAKMRADGFRVYDKRYRIGKLRMLGILLFG